MKKAGEQANDVMTLLLLLLLLDDDDDYDCNDDEGKVVL